MKKDEFIDAEPLDVEEVSDIGTLQIYQQDKALIDMQIETAKRWPRNINKAVENAISIVTLDKEIAESCTYSLKKGKTITGPSINLAKILVQQMGNMRAENRVVSYSATHVTCEAVCFDLERNFAMRTQIKRSIVGSMGRFSEDLCVITGNAGNAIALRNAIFTVIDARIIKKVHEAAKSKITGDISDDQKLIAKRVALMNGFKQMFADKKLTDAEILKALDKQSIEHIDKDDIVVLVGFDTALRSGDTTFESIFRPVESKPAYIKPVAEDKSQKRLLDMIKAASTIQSLEKLMKECTTQETITAYDEAFNNLKNAKK